MPGSNPSGAAKQPDHFIVLIPGYMGSKLRDKDTKKVVWMDVPSILKDPLHIGASIEGILSALAYPGNLEAGGIVDQVLFIPPWVKQEQYGALLTEFKQAGFRDDPDKPPFDRPVVFTFSYDWRQDNRISARQLGEAVKGWSAKLGGAKAWLIGHSNGGIVSRWYIEKEGGKDYVERLYLMGSPWNGAPKALNVLMNGLDMIFLKVLSTDRAKQLMKEVIPTFPSYYQLIPYAAPFIYDEQRTPIDLFADPSWIGGPNEQAMLMDGRKFNEELGNTLSVPTVCFVGRFKPTLTSGLVQRDPTGRWVKVDWEYTDTGDTTVPEASAIHPQARAVHAYAVDHGGTFSSPQVFVQLDLELKGAAPGAQRAFVATDALNIRFEPVTDVFSPGGTLGVWATIEDRKEKKPVSGASVRVQMLFVQGPAGEKKAAVMATKPISLVESPDNKGRYEGQVTAPADPGYYRLEATVTAAGQPAVKLSELVSVDEG